MRMLAHGLARSHRVEVVARRFRQYDGWKRLRKLDEGFSLTSQASFLDGDIPVHSLELSVLDRLRLLPLLMLLIRRPAGVRKDLYRLGYRFFRRVYVPKLRALVRGMDVVHAVKAGYLSLAVEEAARAEGVPFLVTPYVHPRPRDENLSTPTSDRIAFFQRADMVFALLETDKQILIDLGIVPERLRLSGVVPLLPETSDPQGFRARHGLGGAPIVLFVGRMEKYKGCFALLDAASEVWIEMPDVHFIFAGPATDKAADVFRQRSDDRIRYLGLVSDQEKGDAMAACDLFCMPSVAEILPAVYLEAWSHSKPVIGGTAHGLRELVEGTGGGVTVEQRPTAIAQQIVTLLRDEPRRRQMGERGRALVQQRFSVEAVVGALGDAYEAASCARRDRR
jgi:glycosyltransferase involved in cell wall biosynthesis